jgi:Domain of unknown function (DUF1918)
MSVQAGDRIVMESERAAQPGRTGLIEAVLAENPPRYRVRWDDARVSVLCPEAGAARIVARPKRAKATR